jgi:hypothetical protein
VFVLDREDPGSPVIDGDVAHADGSPRRERARRLRRRADADGRARGVPPRVRRVRRADPARLDRARTRAAVLDGFGASFQSPSPPARQHLVLAGPARRLAGRVVDAHGQPCKGFEVHLLGATLLDPGGASRDVAELKAGGPISLRTDAHGAFRFGGLRDRAYGVLAAGARRSTREVALRRDGVPSGTLDLEIVVPRRGRAPIRGRVLDPSGAPVAGVRVGPGRAVPPGDPGEFGRIGGRAATRGPTGASSSGRARGHRVPDRLRGRIRASRSELQIGRHATRSRSARPRREIRIASRASPAPDFARALDSWGARSCSGPATRRSSSSRSGRERRADRRERRHELGRPAQRARARAAPLPRSISSGPAQGQGLEAGAGAPRKRHASSRIVSIAARSGFQPRIVPASVPPLIRRRTPPRRVARSCARSSPGHALGGRDTSRTE